MTWDFVQDLIEACDREGKVFVLAVGDPDSGAVEVFDNADRDGPCDMRGQGVPEILSSSICEALGLDGEEGEEWKRQ